MKEVDNLKRQFSELKQEYDQQNMAGGKLPQENRQKSAELKAGVEEISCLKQESELGGDYKVWTTADGGDGRNGEDDGKDGEEDKRRASRIEAKEWGIGNAALRKGEAAEGDENS